MDDTPSQDRINLRNIAVAAITVVGAVAALCVAKDVPTACVAAVFLISAGGSVWIAWSSHVRSVGTAIADAGRSHAIASAEDKTAALHKLHTPRQLTPAQISTLSTALAAFKGTGVLAIRSAALEPRQISDQIFAAMADAGWSGRVWTGTNVRRAVSGILIEMHEDANHAQREAATTLAGTLPSVGLATDGPIAPTGLAMTGKHGVWSSFGPEEVGRVWIVIEIGTK